MGLCLMIFQTILPHVLIIFGLCVVGIGSVVVLLLPLLLIGVQCVSQLTVICTLSYVAVVGMSVLPIGA